jgi:signal transduction histidine kinase
LKAAQDQILRTRRLAALGSLGAGVAHELNNPLTSVLGLVGLVRMNLPDESPDAESLDTALSETRRIGTIVARLKDLTETEREEGRARFELEKPVRDALSSIAARAASQRVVVTSAIDTKGLKVLGDVTQMQELLGHLIDNALHAMPDGGTLDVSATTVDGALKVTVGDSGKGIPAPLLERIFDPFFTTKADPQRAGVGLGLSSAHRLVERFHGRIAVMSEPGRGTMFTIMLPAAGEDPHLA